MFGIHFNRAIADVLKWQSIITPTYGSNLALVIAVVSINWGFRVGYGMHSGWSVDQYHFSFLSSIIFLLSSLSMQFCHCFSGFLYT